MTLLLMIVVTEEAHAQQSMSYGLTLGVSGARESADGETYGERWFGPSAGFFVDVPVRGVVSVLGEALYEQKGVSFDEIRDVNNRDLEEATYHYATALVAARLSRALSSGQVIPYAYAGPRFSVLVADTVSPSDVGIPEDQRAGNSVVFGARAGIGAELPDMIGFPALVELYFDRDLTSAVDITFLRGDSERTLEIAYRSLGFRIGILF